MAGGVGRGPGRETAQTPLPIRVQDCQRPGFLASAVGVDLFGRDEAKAKTILRATVAGAVTGRPKPAAAPTFPGAGRAMPRQDRFPGTLPTVWRVAARNPNLALILRDLGQPGPARPLAERAMTITETSYGPDHPTTHVVRANPDKLPR